MGLVLLHGSEPRSNHEEDGLDAFDALQEPSEIVRFTVDLDRTTKQPLQPEEDPRWQARLAVLGRGYTDAAPMWGVLPCASARKSEVALAVEEARSPRNIELLRYVPRDDGRVLPVVGPLPPRRTRYISPDRVLTPRGTQRGSGLGSLDWSQLTPQKRDRGLSLLEPVRPPHIHVVASGPGDRSHPQDRCLKSKEHFGGSRMAGLSDGHLEAEILRTILALADKRRTLTIEEAGRPGDLERIELRESAWMTRGC